MFDLSIPKALGNQNRKSESRVKSVLAGALGLAVVLAGAPALATTITDPAGDFLSTYTGPHDGDMDVLSVSVAVSGADFWISGTMNGPIGTTANSEYVFGVNTGGAGAPFAPLETGVLFNSVVVLLPNGTGVVVDNIASPTITPLSSVTVSGDTISAMVPIALLPSTGWTPDIYGWNLWPRLTPMPFANISDFAPDDSTFAAVPEPATWALMIVGFLGVGAMRRARRRSVRATI
jgi:hypothetical protein